MPIDLISDTVTRPTPGTPKAMRPAKVGDDVFNEDASAHALQAHAAAMFGHEAALFMPSGVMSNQIAIKAHTEPMDELIKIVEGFYACGVAASVYGTTDALTGTWTPEPVFSNIGKLLLATQIYDMHRLAHEVSGGLIVTLPGPDEDHNPATAGRLAPSSAVGSKVAL